MITARRRPAAAAPGVIALALALCACTGPTATSPAPAPTPSSGSTTTTVATTPTQELTAQGFLPKKVGQIGGLDCTNDIESCAIKFTVDKIDVSPQCDQYGTKAVAGRKTVVLHVSLTTGALSPDGEAAAPMIFNPYSLKGLGADGFVHDAQSGMCTSYETRLSNTILPNSRYTGTVEVEVPESVSSIAAAYSSGGPNRGWVWEIGG